LFKLNLPSHSQHLTVTHNYTQFLHHHPISLSPHRRPAHHFPPPTIPQHETTPHSTTISHTARSSAPPNRPDITPETTALGHLTRPLATRYRQGVRRHRSIGTPEHPLDSARDRCDVRDPAIRASISPRDAELACTYIHTCVVVSARVCAPGAPITRGRAFRGGGRDGRDCQTPSRLVSPRCCFSFCFSYRAAGGGDLLLRGAGEDRWDGRQRRDLRGGDSWSAHACALYSVCAESIRKAKKKREKQREVHMRAYVDAQRRVAVQVRYCENAPRRTRPAVRRMLLHHARPQRSRPVCRTGCKPTVPPSPSAVSQHGARYSGIAPPAGCHGWIGR
jgi:hypothetical protein